MRHVTSQLPGLLLTSGHDPPNSLLKRAKLLSDNPPRRFSHSTITDQQWKIL